WWLFPAVNPRVECATHPLTQVVLTSRRLQVSYLLPNCRVDRNTINQILLSNRRSSFAGVSESRRRRLKFFLIRIELATDSRATSQLRDSGSLQCTQDPASQYPCAAKDLAHAPSH